MPELRLVEVADEDVELALVELAAKEYELRLRVHVGFRFSVFPVHNAGLYVFRFGPAALNDFLRDLDAGRKSRHRSIADRRGSSIAIMSAPSAVPLRDVVLRIPPILGIPAPPVRTTIPREALEQLRDYRQRHLAPPD